MTAKKTSPLTFKKPLIIFGASFVAAGTAFALAYGPLPEYLSVSYTQTEATSTAAVHDPSLPPPPPPLDRVAYDKELLALAHVATSSPWYTAFLSATTTITLPGTTTPLTVKPQLWPVRAPYPADGRALLPSHRIVAYYGNFYSRGMGVLGQYDPPEMLARLKEAVAAWQAADPSTPVVPAIHYIVEVAQGAAGKDGTYRTRMPDDQIDKALELAKEVNGEVFLDFQVGLSSLPHELPIYESYFKLPNVHLAIDPEFAMQSSGIPPGKVIGTFDASDVNYAVQYLANLVRTYDLPPKILVVHRFTQDMVTHAEDIKPAPEVQVVIDMDGWGDQAKKKGTYNNIIYPEPVQFTGFKLFYKNDLLPPSTGMLSPAQVLQLTPAPVYIQYQ